MMTGNWLISGTYLTTMPKIITEKWRLLTLSFTSLYLLYLIGMLYSTDFAYGWFDLEVKLSLFIFPVIFATSDLSNFDNSRLRIFFGSFLAGCMLGSLVLLGHAWIANERWGVPDAFYYTNLAWYFHSSYLSMYYSLGIGIALSSLAVDFSKQAAAKTTGLFLIILYLETFIFLLSSKAGMLTLVMTEALFILLLIYKRAGAARIFVVSVVFVAIFIGFSSVFPFAMKRISTADSAVSTSRSAQPDHYDGTTARMEIWKISVGLIKQNFMFGVGTGDVKNVLIEAYRQHDLYPVVKKKLNAHNQYLQTFLTLGVFGFSLLVVLLLYPACLSLRKGNFLYTLFILIFAVNILFESMLEAQAGVVFYAFFNALLFSKSVCDRPSVKVPS